MDTRSEIRDFLTSRRAKLTRDQVGLPDYDPRRVPGLTVEQPEATHAIKDAIQP